jgi:hypothetical protein
MDLMQILKGLFGLRTDKIQIATDKFGFETDNNGLMRIRN